MRKKPIVALSLFLSLPALFASPARGQVVIAKKGKPAAIIVVSAEAGPTEKYAADELGFFLHFIVGAPIPVVTDSRPEPDAASWDTSLAPASPPFPGSRPAGAPSRLLVGEAAVRLAQPAFRAATLAPEEIIVRTHGRDLLLAGGTPRGTLYAVYALLEDVLDCRWWAPDAWRIPRRPSLALDPLAIRFAPPLEYREPFWFAAFDSDWAARNRANGVRAAGGHGGHHIYEGFVHTFYSLIPPDKYFSAHPEWFAEIDGRRTSDNAQLCLTNEDMRRELVKNLRQRLRENPAATIASVSQNDCQGNCTCPRCRAVDTEEGSPSGSLLRFVNAVAADLQAEFPNVAIDTLAYQYSRKPPRIIRPRPNVIVRLCSIECSFARPLDDPANQAFLDDLRGWSKIAHRLFVWDYTTDFSHYIQPHPNYGVLGPNIRLFAAHGVTGIFEQGAYESPGSEMAELRAWMLAKLLWDPSLDPALLRREFLDGYYGPAGRGVGDCLALLESAVRASGDKLGCYSPTTAGFLSLDTMSRAWRILNDAEKKVSGRPELARRVRRAELPVGYVALSRWDEFRGEAANRKLKWPWPEMRSGLFDWFVKTCRAEGVTTVSEGQSLDKWVGRGGSAR